MAAEKDIITKALEDCSNANRSAVEIVRDALGGDTKLGVTFRRPVEEPVLAKTPRRSHRFESVVALKAYVAKWAKAACLGLIDAATGDAAIVLDESLANGVEVVKFYPREHPLLTPWTRAISRQGGIGVADFIQLITANRRSVTMPPAQQLLATVRQLRITKTTTLECGQGCDTLNGVMVHTEIKGVSQDHLVSLPETITITSPVFIERMFREIQVDLMVSEVQGSGEEPIRIRMTSSDLEVLRLEEIADIATEIKDAMPDGAVVGFGSVAHSPWAYVGQ
jgi:hypothetical protein